MIAAAPSVLTFASHAGGLTAMLGVWPVGEVAAVREGEYRATWRVNLTGAATYWRYAPSIEVAQARLQNKIMEWIDAAGLAPALPIDGVIRSSTNGNGNGDRKRA